MAAVRLRDSLNEDIFEKRNHYSQVLLITVHYIRLLRTTLSLLIVIHSLLLITYSVFPVNTSKIYVLQGYYTFILFYFI